MNCKICQQKYQLQIDTKIPRVLTQCGHTFCTSCINKNLQNYKISCKQCHKTNFGQNYTSFPVNQTLIALLRSNQQSIHQNINNSHNQYKQQQLCKLHKKRLQAFCENDNQLLCLNCVLTTHKSHKVFSITQVTNLFIFILILQKVQKDKSILSQCYSELLQTRSHIQSQYSQSISLSNQLHIDYKQYIFQLSLLTKHIISSIKQQQQKFIKSTQKIYLSSLKQIQKVQQQLKQKQYFLNQLDNMYNELINMGQLQYLNENNKRIFIMENCNHKWNKKIEKKNIQVDRVIVLNSIIKIIEELVIFEKKKNKQSSDKKITNNNNKQSNNNIKSSPIRSYSTTYHHNSSSILLLSSQLPTQSPSRFSKKSINKSSIAIQQKSKQPQILQVNLSEQYQKYQNMKNKKKSIENGGNNGVKMTKVEYNNNNEMKKDEKKDINNINKNKNNNSRKMSMSSSNNNVNVNVNITNNNKNNNILNNNNKGQPTSNTKIKQIDLIQLKKNKSTNIQKLNTNNPTFNPNNNNNNSIFHNNTTLLLNDSLLSQPYSFSSIYKHNNSLSSINLKLNQSQIITYSPVTNFKYYSNQKQKKIESPGNEMGNINNLQLSTPLSINSFMNSSRYTTEHKDNNNNSNGENNSNNNVYNNNSNDYNINNMDTILKDSQASFTICELQQKVFHFGGLMNHSISYTKLNHSYNNIIPNYCNLTNNQQQQHPYQSIPNIINRNKCQSLILKSYSNKKCLILGGKDMNGQRTNSIIQFDLQTYQLKKTNLYLTQSISGFGCVNIIGAGDRFYVFGGSTINGAGKSMVEYKLVKDKGNNNTNNSKGWSFEVKKMPSMINTRDQLGYCLGFDNCIYACGGINSSNTTLNTCQKFNPITNKWLSIPAMLYPRRSFTLISLPNGIYAIGGHNGKNPLKSVQFYDYQIQKWIEISSLNQARFTHTAITTKDYQSIYVYGGYCDEGLKSVEKYSVIENKWKIEKNMDSQRFLHCSIYVQE